MKKTVLIILLSLVLASCSTREAINAAEKASTPLESLRIIREAIAEKCKNSFRSCDVPNALQQAESDYFTKAVREGNSIALREMYERPSYSRNLDLQIELKDKVLGMASTSSDADLLAAAAAIYGNDAIGVVDSTKQVEYFSRAWLAGDARSAGRLAHIYVRLKDYENAYLWSLRCINKCERSAGVQNGESSDQIQLRSIESKLSAGQIVRLQQLAASKTL